MRPQAGCNEREKSLGSVMRMIESGDSDECAIEHALHCPDCRRFTTTQLRLRYPAKAAYETWVN